MAVTQRTRLQRRDSARAFHAFLAALHRAGLEEMVVSEGQDLHRPFAAALDVLSRNPSTSEAFERFRASPRDEVVGEFDDALMRASKYHLVRFPNSSYTRIGISMTQQDANAFLDEVGDVREIIEEAAQEFRRKYLKITW